MTWWRFWEHKETEATSDDTAPRRTTTAGTMPTSSATKEPTRTAPTSDAKLHHLEQLRKRRDGIRFDLARAEEASLPDNPWTQRIALLDDAIATVETDLAALDNLVPLPPFPLPKTPIANIDVTTGDQAEVRFSIGAERFHFAEAIDWDERGGPEVRGDLRHQSGNASRLVPDDVPSDRRDTLERHLIDSVAVFAVDLRNRALDGQSLPGNATLSDLATPCPVCGGWRDWRGICDACTQRAWQRQQLRAETERLAAEQANETEERHKWAERLPIARRRLADIDAAITKRGDES